MITIGFSTRKIDNNFVELLKKSSGISNPEIIPVENNGQFSLTEVMVLGKKAPMNFASSIASAISLV